MNEFFGPTAPLVKPWTAEDDHFTHKGKDYYYKDLQEFRMTTTPTTPLTAGQVRAITNDGKTVFLAFKFADKARAHKTIAYINEQIDAAKGIVKGYKYNMTAHTGTRLEAYDDYLIIYHMQVGSMATNIMRGGTLGGKKINYEDLTSVQFREPAGATVGFLQFAYPGAVESKGGVIDMLNDENSVPVHPNVYDEAKEIYEFIEQRRKEIKAENKAASATTVIQEKSAAEQIKEFKELLDMGIISQEEFDAKKKQLLGL